MDEYTQEDLQEAQRLITGHCGFLRGIQTLEQLPDESLPEVAFAGRSNVGKSSLINALTGRKALARTSNTPGRTQQLNFFDLGPEEAPRLRLVDMPGYGYAKVSKSDRKRWQNMMKHYLRGRLNLKRAFVLIDGRHGVKDSDKEMMDMLDQAAVSYTLVLTKTDKVKSQERAQILADTQTAIKKRPAAFPEILPTSSENGYGIDDLRVLLYREAMIV
tara:strand:+ start:1180 stop:1830 length:651 start_codon:yes stop_codon:yes gene_type:complete